MVPFIKSVLRWLASLVVALFLFVGLSLALLVGLVMALTPAEPEPEPEAVLVLDLDFLLTDSPRGGSMAQVLRDAAVSGRDGGHYTLLEVTQAIQAARFDSGIKGLLLQGQLLTDAYGGSLAAVSELREVIAEFSQDKPVWAVLQGGSLRDYYLKSAAEHVYMDPLGELRFNGLSMQMLFLGDALENLGVDFTVFQGGSYKTSLDGLTRQAMTPADREQFSELMDDIWQAMLSDIGASRGLTVDVLSEVSREFPVLTADRAAEKELISGIRYGDEWIDEILQTTGVPARDGSFAQRSFRRYLAAHRGSRLPHVSDSGRIGLIYVEGSLNYSMTGDQSISAAAIARELRRMGEDPQIHAVVLRVNSPGGTVDAGEAIRREVVQLRERKPVVVSMGGMAASAGYWLATGADQIVAQPTSLTGSIGVIGMHVNFEALADKLEVNFEEFGVNENARFLSATRSLTEFESDWFAERIDRAYRQFVDRVAEGRGMSWDEAHVLAQGRIWSGSRAQANDLVDELGGLYRSIEVAAELAGLDEPWMVDPWPRRGEWFYLMEDLLESEWASSLVGPLFRDSGHPLLSHWRQQWQHFAEMEEPSGIKAGLPFSLTID